MNQIDRIKADLRTFQLTGQLPAAWEPDTLDDIEAELETLSGNGVDGEFDRRLAEINAELDAIESGSAEPPALGWINRIGR